MDRMTADVACIWRGRIGRAIAIACRSRSKRRTRVQLISPRLRDDLCERRGEDETAAALKTMLALPRARSDRVSSPPGVGNTDNKIGRLLGE